jgi:putative ABC transport system substrate-binding protein
VRHFQISNLESRTRAPAIFGVGLALGFVVTLLTAEAQQTGKPARVGYLAGAPREQMTHAQNFVAALGEMGFVEGQNLVIEYRHGNSQEGFRELAISLVQVRVDVVYAANPYALQAARDATTSIPIVGYDLESDPVAAGFAASLAHPGGNITGVFLDQFDVGTKQLQLLAEMVPRLSRVAVLWDAPLSSAQLRAVEDAARRIGVTVSPIVWRGPDELPGALQAAAREGARGLIYLSTPRIEDRYIKLVADIALRSRLPSIGSNPAFGRDGGLISYGPVRRDMQRTAATLVAKILRGARPADLPIERPARFDMVINLKTAKALGLAIPPSLLMQADEVIE